MLTITIITVAYNSEKTIADTLKSVSDQTYPCIEHIIVDGNSKDNTLTIINKFKHIKKVISEPDNGKRIVFRATINNDVFDIRICLFTNTLQSISNCFLAIISNSNNCNS